MKKIILLGIFAFVIIAFGSPWLNEQVDRVRSNETIESISNLAPEVETLLNEKIELISEYLQNPIFIQEIEKSNEKNVSLLFKDILRLDEQWRMSKDDNDSFISPFLKNTVALELLKIQKDHPEFSEIFITDRYGLNVGQTNKTSDYYQADEEWWINAYNNGQGRASHGEIEFDESSQTKAIAIYVPIVELGTNRTIGITKVVIDILAIIDAL